MTGNATTDIETPYNIHTSRQKPPQKSRQKQTDSIMIGMPGWFFRRWVSLSSTKTGCSSLEYGKPPTECFFLDEKKTETGRNGEKTNCAI